VRPGNGKCPPSVTSDPHDANIFGHVPAANDYLMSSYHWDDGNGNDLTLEEWCIADTLAFFAERLIQSRNGVLTTVVSPGGVTGGVDPGPC
jgi:hypothetical protein